ncbi:hypothetical protein LPMP_200460 [Leishmania panamensis]|uniref:Uncharacterized protein n=1 Tax=Leishmania panamensis TaxID=5679 RepID=A0A088RNL3_LEIPA|nr:hypothetical protein LPMP_200460 [Leishmania panamensis]AIN97538.1 hypothetical protein LPMP_200460 [Leishmania panamensis]
MRAATDVLTISASPSETESLARAAVALAGGCCSSSIVTGNVASATACFTSPLTPKSTPPSTVSRCLVRPVLRQRSHSSFDGSLCPPQQSSCTFNHSLATRCESEREGDSGVKMPATKEQCSMHTVVCSRCPGAAAGQQERRQWQEGAAETAVGSDDAAEDTASGGAKENDRVGHNNNSSSSSNGGTTSGVLCPVVQPLSDHTTTAFSGSTRDQQDKWYVVTCSTPSNSARPRGEALVSLSSASCAPHFSASTAHNSSASSNFHVASAGPTRGTGATRSHTADPSFSSSALPHSAQLPNAKAKAVPLLLVNRLSTHCVSEELGSPVTSRPASRHVVSGASLTLLQGPLGTPLGSGATSLDSVTPLSSNWSSARTSFMRPPSLTRSSGAASTQGGSDHGSITVPGGLPQTCGGGGSGGPTGVIPHSVNGRVLCSSHGARQPDLGARRTTFQRSASSASPSVATSSRGAPPPSDPSEWSSSAAVTKDTTSARPPPSMSREMQSFVLGQYRTLQRAVLLRPAPPQSVDADESSADFQHIKRTTCPKHSKAAKETIKAQEVVRLRTLQQHHHDMEVIRNGGREHVGPEMKSSVVLAGALSKLRARTRCSLSRSAAVDLGGSVETSFVGSPDERNVAALYSRDGSSDATHEKNGAAQSPRSEGEPEAWHTSKAFMEFNAPADARCKGQKWGHVNKNRMKSEEIVMAVVFDSDDEETDASGTSSVETQRRSSVGLSHRSAQLSPMDVGEFSSNTAEKRAGERLVSQPQRRRGAAAPARCATPPLHGSSSGSEESRFACNNQRRSSALNIPSLYATQPLEPCSPLATSTSAPPAFLPTHSHDASHHHSNSAVTLLERRSPERDGDEDAEDECCHCCPCKHPKNFFALCRANSQSTASLVCRGEQRNVGVSRTDEGTQLISRLAQPAASVKPMAERQPSTVMSCANSDACSVVVEDLENNDGDEVMLSMQSFRRSNIRRIR